MDRYTEIERRLRTGRSLPEISRTRLLATDGAGGV